MTAKKRDRSGNKRNAPASLRSHSAESLERDARSSTESRQQRAYPVCIVTASPASHPCWEIRLFRPSSPCESDVGLLYKYWKPTVTASVERRLPSVCHRRETLARGSVCARVATTGSLGRHRHSSCCCHHHDGDCEDITIVIVVVDVCLFVFRVTRRPLYLLFVSSSSSQAIVALS